MNKRSAQTLLCAGNLDYYLGSGCDSVCRVVASDIRGLRFESSHQQKHLFAVNCIEKTKIKKKEAGNAPFF